MKLLVTGGAGFIGSNFIHYWLQHHPQDEIINLDVLTYAGNLDNLREIEEKENYSFVRGDINDREVVEDLIFKVDIVINFAAETHVDRSIQDSNDFVKTNIEGVKTLLEVCRKHNTRFHQISTDEVFGSLSFSESSFKEDTPYDPRSPYSASKAAADHLVRAYYHTYNLPITISNCSNNYGPYQFPEKLIPLFITNLLQEKSVPVYGKGDNVRDWIYVEDHIRGIEKIITQGKIGETYCLGGNSELSNLELTKRILHSMGETEDKIQYVKDRPGHDLRYSIDYTKAKQELNWEPHLDFNTGLLHTIEWYQHNYTWWKQLI